MKYTITLADGSKLENLTLAGNMYVSGRKLTEANFAGKLSHVTVEHEVTHEGEDGEKSTYIERTEMINVVLGQLLDGDQLNFTDYAGKSIFSLHTYSPEEFFQVRTESRLDYLEMMAD